MGLLINGEWADQWYDTKATGGKFVRTEAQFRNWITADGSAGPSGKAGFRPDRDAIIYTFHMPALGRIAR